MKLLKKLPPKRILVPLLIGAVLVVAGGVYWHSHRTKTETPVAVTPQPTTGPVTPPTPTPNENVPGGPDNQTVEDRGASLIAPFGTFVSNHHPNLSGSPAPNQMNSQCSTTNGATCVIEFSKDGVTKSLPAKAVGNPADKGDTSQATVTWNWKLQDIGLTQGTWHITAKATLDSASKTADDPLTLEVGP